MNAPRILVVEDELVILMDIQERLLGLGYQVAGAAIDADEAVRAAEEQSPDLVLMDVFLAGRTDGIEAAERIRSRFGIPVVFLTAFGDTATFDRAKITSPFGYILKPFQDRELQLNIELALYKHHVEEDQRVLQSRLLQANKLTLLGTLTSGLAHEVNNPNNFILFNAQLLSDIWTDLDRLMARLPDEGGGINLGGLPLNEAREAIPRLLSGVVEGARRIRGIVENLQRYVRNEPVRPTGNADLNQVVRDAVLMAEYEIRRHTTHFSLELSPEHPVARGNPQQLGQVATNLILNALKALPGKQSGVTVSTLAHPSRQRVGFRIADKGVGMSEQIREAATEPFFTTRAHLGGTGLGLYICRNILHAHSGNLEIQSAEGQGTVATVWLPAAEKA